MLKRIVPMMLLGLCVFAQRSAAQQPPVSVLLDNARDFANQVVGFAGDTRISGTWIDSALKNARQTIEAVDKALAAGVPATRTVNLQGDKTMTLSEIKAMSEGIARVAIKSAASFAITQTSGWPKWIADGTIQQEIQAKTALQTSKECVDRMDQALANGVSPAADIGDRDVKMTFAEGRDMCVYVRDTAQKIVDKGKAAEDAQYEPFRKLLSGDKLRVYSDRLKIYKVYGAGGKVLRTPEDYRDSALWCTTGVDRAGILPVWSVDCWHFRGMTMIGSVVSRTGTGDEAPSSAFR